MTRFTNPRRRTAAHLCVCALLIAGWAFAAVAHWIGTYENRASEE